MCNNTAQFIPSLSLTCFSSHPLWAKKIKFRRCTKIYLFFDFCSLAKCLNEKFRKLHKNQLSNDNCNILFYSTTCVKEFTFFSAKLSINLAIAIIRNNFCEHAMTANSTAAAFMLFESANWIFFCAYINFILFLLCVYGYCWW